MIRDDIKTALVTAMKGGDKPTTATLRLVQSAIKNRDIEVRGAIAQSEGRVTVYEHDGTPVPPRKANVPADDDALVTEVLQKMVKQRRESIEFYEKGNRQELADAEGREVAVIERFLPARMSDDETRAAIETIKAETGAAGMKDMGRVMAELKARHGTQLDMSRASGLVKAALS